MTSQDRDNSKSSLYVLACSTTGTLISLAAVWIYTASTYAPGVVA
jgi:hypothetical protein